MPCAHEDRRDGSGLLFMVLAVGIATFEWWGLTGWLADGIHGVLRGTVAAGSRYLLPPMLLIFAVRVFRQPTNVRGNNRVAIGFSILSGGRLGAGPFRFPGPALRWRPALTAWAQRRRHGGPRGPRCWPVLNIWAGRGRLGGSGLRQPADPHRHGLSVRIPARLRALYGHLMGVDLQDNGPGEQGA